MIIGAALYLLYPFVSMFVYGIGTIMFSMMQVRAEYMGPNVTIIRLRRQQLLGCCCFILALAMMSMQLHKWGFFRRQEWIVALTVGCILELYTSFRIPQELKTEK